MSTSVTFYKDDKYTGKSRTFTGVQSVSDLSKVYWDASSTHDDMKDDITSLKTSGQAWVRLYSKANYGGRTVLVNPSTSISDLKNLQDDTSSGDMDDTIESFEIFDHKPDVNTTNITNNFVALYPGAVVGRKDNLYEIEFYAQDSQYRIYYPTLTLEDDILHVTLNLDHIQAEKDDHAVVTFSMDMHGGFVDSIQVTYQMADATQIPDWLIKLTDGVIDLASDAAKVIADGAEIVITDGVGVVATVEVNKVIDFTADALTFAVDHLNTVLSAVFTYQDDGGTTNFPAEVSHAIARLILAYYQELFGKDTNPAMTFSETAFLSALGRTGWDTSKHNPSAPFSQGGYSFRAYFPDNSFLYAHGGAISSVKIDAVTSDQKDDHLVLQAAYAPDGRLFSVAGAVDIFSRSQPDGYQSPASGLILYNSDGQMIQITQDGTVTPLSYASLEDAFVALLKAALDDAQSTWGISITAQQKTLVDAARSVLNAITAAI